MLVIYGLLCLRIRVFVACIGWYPGNTKPPNHPNFYVTVNNDPRSLERNIETIAGE